LRCGRAFHKLCGAALFLPGLRSTFFGPVKYAILPQALHSADSNSPPALAPSGANQQFPSPRFSPDA
jgi:hypothetical protein